MVSRICSRRPVGDARASRREAATDSSLMKKKLKVLVLFDGTSPTTVNQDFSAELKTKEWKTEADVMNALGALGHAPEHLAIYDDVDLLRQKLETFAPEDRHH